MNDGPPKGGPYVRRRVSFDVVSGFSRTRHLHRVEYVLHRVFHRTGKQVIFGTFDEPRADRIVEDVSRDDEHVFVIAQHAFKSYRCHRRWPNVFS
jgi:hypothetical protein